MKRISSFLGMIAGFISISLFILLIFFNPYSPVEIGTIIMTFFMLFLPACLVIVAAIRSNSFEMLIAFVWSLPFSLYFAATPGLFSLFGITSFLYLTSFILMKLHKKRTS